MSISLPTEILIEIFTFLSVKHLGSILSIDKSTHDQLINSEIFWRNLLEGYSKLIVIIVKVPLKIIHDHSSLNYTVAKMNLLELFELKQEEIIKSKKNHATIQKVISSLENEKKTIRLRFEKSQMMLVEPLTEQFNKEIEDMKKKSSRIEAHLQSLQSIID